MHNSNISSMILSIKFAGFEVLEKGTTDLPTWCKHNQQYPESPYDVCTSYTLGDMYEQPCVRPPWAKMMAIDFKEKRIMWERPFGFTPGYGYEESYGQT